MQVVVSYFLYYCV